MMQLGKIKSDKLEFEQESTETTLHLYCTSTSIASTVEMLTHNRLSHRGISARLDAAKGLLDGGDLLDDILGGVQVDQALVDPAAVFMISAS